MPLSGPSVEVSARRDTGRNQPSRHRHIVPNAWTSISLQTLWCKALGDFWRKRRAAPAEGAETPAAPPPAALPDWPWRAVAKLVLEWLAVPSTDEEWREPGVPPVQRSVYKAWKSSVLEAQERLRR